MDISKHSFLTVNEILADVLKLVDDERMEFNNKGHYVSQIQQALEGLSFDTFFDERTEDFPFPKEELKLAMPIGTFNLKDIFLFTGNTCDITRSQKVWWKKNYFTNGNGYFADNKGNNTNDPFFPSNILRRNDRLPGTNLLRRTSSVEHTYFYNIQNGIIMFSSICRNFPMVHLVYNGTGCDIGVAPIIPQFLREAVLDFVCEYSFRIKLAKDKSAAYLWQMYDKRLNRDGQYGLGVGSWYRAEHRVKTMSASERSDFFEYIGRGEWQSGL